VPLLPGGDFIGEGDGIWHAPVQALAAEHAQLDFRNVEPAAVLGGVVQLQLLGQAFGLGRWEGVVEGAGRVGVEVV
jgi:hypothetical protein